MPVDAHPEQGEPLLALAALLTAYGLAEVLQGYGFLAVFVAALALRSAERGSDYHQKLHDFAEELERLLMMVLLVLLGGAITGGGLTVIANAPNPAGFSILRGGFADDTISAWRLFAGALLPTLVAIAAFRAF